LISIAKVRELAPAIIARCSFTDPTILFPLIPPRMP
jgi:hypothetical protein